MYHVWAWYWIGKDCDECSGIINWSRVVFVWYCCLFFSPSFEFFPSFELVFQQSVECPPWQMLAIGRASAPSLICIQRLHLDSAPTAVVIYGNLWHNLSYWLFGLWRLRWLMMRSSLICIERHHLDSAAAGVPWNVIYGNRIGFEKSSIDGNRLLAIWVFDFLVSWDSCAGGRGEDEQSGGGGALKGQISFGW